MRYTGANYGLTPLKSDFVDQVESEIPVKDVSKVNGVIRIGTIINNFIDKNGDAFYFTCMLYHLCQTCVSLLYPQNYHHMHGGHSLVHGI